MSKVNSVNPYTNQLIESHSLFSDSQVAASIKQAEGQFEKSRDYSMIQKKSWMLEVASLLEERKHQYATTISAEMGKPITQAIAEVEKCVWVCRFYATEAEEMMKTKPIQTDASESYVSYEPIGVVLAVMPWNYPFWQVFRFAAPALMAGNVCVLKHASNVFGCAKHIEQLFSDAGFPPHCFINLPIQSNQVEQVIVHPAVKAVTLTGSTAAGSAVAAIAGKNIKKTVLELGGNNAMIVLPNCDLDSTVEKCVQARFQNTGQSCIAGKRLLLHTAISEVFIEKILEKTASLKSGDPAVMDTYIGTLAREDLAIELEEQLNRSLAMGGRILCGGRREGAYFEPTIVAGVSPAMPLFKEETFGPVLAVTTFDDIKEAIELSNNSDYGLGVSIFTSEIEAIKKYIAYFEEGAVFVNDFVKSDPRLPFGGVKASGYGRELSKDGLHEFLNRKTVYIKR